MEYNVHEDKTCADVWGTSLKTDLNNPNDAVGGILDGHGEDGVCVEVCASISCCIKAWVLGHIRNVQGLLCTYITMLTLLQFDEWYGHSKGRTSPVVATCPEIPMWKGKRFSKGLVRDSHSTPIESITSRSNTRLKVLFVLSCSSITCHQWGES